MTGTVLCIACRGKFPPSCVDIVGQGYRCTACSQRAEIERLNGGSEAASHFTPAERERLRASGSAALWIGVGSLILGIGLCVLLFGLAASDTGASSSGARKLGMYVGIPIILFAVGSIVTGQKWRTAAR